MSLFLQALEMLATECTIKLKTFGPNALTDPIISKIEDCFDMDGVLDDLGDVEESRLLTEDGYSDSIRLLGDIGMTNTRQLSAFKEFLFGTRKALESGDAEFEKSMVWCV